MMSKATQFKPGNPGRPKGIPNKATSDLRASIQAFLDRNWPQVQKEFDSLDAKDKLQFIDRMLAYSLPKLQATALNVSADIDGLSNQQVDDLFIRLTENINNEQV